MEVEIVPTGGPLGVEVRGLDLREDPSPAAIDALRDALRDELLLLFRGQELDGPRLLRIADWFGGAYRPRADEPTLGDASLEPVVIVSNVHERGVLGADRVRGHADQEYLQHPSPATLLFAVEVPSRGGDTSWTNLIRAYDELPARLKRRAVRWERWTRNPYAEGTNRVASVTGANQRIGTDRYPEVWHPLVPTQDGTGRRALYVSSLTTGLRGLRGPAAAWRARRLLRRLKRHVAQERFAYRHAWKPGDLIVWNNLFTNHSRDGFDPGERRVLLRVQVAARP
jgi:taurine dioxygenase